MKQINHLLTKQGKDLTGKEYDIYPRPQLKRSSFLSLNGEWELECNDKGSRKILVPYPPESILSGINENMGKDPTLIYKKSFVLPEGFIKDKVIINFGAVDQSCTLFVNGGLVGKHSGGYNSFSFDITKQLNTEKNCENHIVLHVKDELSSKVLPYGKQRYKRGGMWYTPISGIWQSVWLESVPKEYVRYIKIDTQDNNVKINLEGISTDGTLYLKTPSGEVKHKIVHGSCQFKIDNPRYWSPSDPYLYYFAINTAEDKVESYLALRTISVENIDKYPRICLNGKPFFFHAVLDQGYFSDGIYTPASYELYTEDITKMKELGFNTLRKHIKVEPEWFYYECDRLGMVVLQDMVNNGSYSFVRDTALPTVLSKRFPEKLLLRSKKQKEAFEKGLKKTVRQLYNHPCILGWTIFNEGWGQFESERMYELLSSLDSSRIIDTTSGWFKGRKSDVESLHIYFKPVKIKRAEKPIILSEFGGYSFKEEGHCANLEKTYGYKLFKERDKLENAIKDLYLNEIVPAIKQGLCGSVYTQLSDVEDETNGLLTYDRYVTKVSKECMLEIADNLKI